MKKFRLIQERLQEINFVLTDLSTTLEKVEHKTNYLEMELPLNMHEALHMASLLESQTDARFCITKVEKLYTAPAATQIGVRW